MRKHFPTVSRVLASRFFYERREIEILGHMCLLHRKVFRKGTDALLGEQTLIFTEGEWVQKRDGSVHVTLKSWHASSKDLLDLKNPENPAGEVHVFRPVSA